MSTALRRSAAVLRRTGAARRLSTTGGSAAEGAAAQGPPPPPNGDWVRWINEIEKSCKQHKDWKRASKEFEKYCKQQGSYSESGFKQWGVHGPSLVYVNGHRPRSYVAPILAGAALWYAFFHETPSDNDKNEVLARQLQDETRELKLQLALIKQSIEHVKATQPAYPIYTPRP